MTHPGPWLITRRGVVPMNKADHANAMAIGVGTMGWKYCEPSGEPQFWYRKAHEFEIEGLDPLTGLIIAYSEEECTALDDVGAEEMAAHGQFGVGA